MMLESGKFGQLYEWEKWTKDIPFVRFPANWEVKIVPPFAGAVVRFVAKVGKKEISVYLDCYENLGYFGSPHWEAYPINDNNMRYALKDWKKMIRAMNKEFNS